VRGSCPENGVVDQAVAMLAREFDYFTASDRGKSSETTSTPTVWQPWLNTRFRAARQIRAGVPKIQAAIPVLKKQAGPRPSVDKP
jgi:hypothetical protein